VVQINFAKREINCKLVYYGPGLSGKTTNLEVVHKKAPASKKGELTSIATEGDRTLFFDYMPLELGKVGGMNTKFQLYTVPGQVYYNATRKLVLQGADGVVFVADSQPDKMDENLESLQNLEDNLKEQGLDIKTLPLVLQWNKRDLPNVLPVDVLEKKINRFGAPTFNAVAVTGEGVFPTLKKLAQMVLEKLNKEYGLQTEKPGEEGGAPAAPAAAPKAPAKPSGANIPKVEKKPAPAAEPAPAAKADSTAGSRSPVAKAPAKAPAEAAPKPVAARGGAGNTPASSRPVAPAEKEKPVAAASSNPSPTGRTSPSTGSLKKPAAEDAPAAKKPADLPWGVTGNAPEPKGGKGKIIVLVLLLLIVAGAGAAYVTNFMGARDWIMGLINNAKSN